MKEHSLPKNDASEFFKKNSIQPAPSTGQFKEQLREEVLAHYFTFNNKKEMEETQTSKRFFMKPGFIAGFFAIAFIAVGTPLFILATDSNDSSNNNQVASGDLGGTIAFYEGDLEKVNSDGGWADVTGEESISEGDSFRVSGDGRAVFNLDDGSSVRISADSAVTFTSLNPENIVISNDTGEVYTRVVALDRDFSVVADDITYASLGTAYKTTNTDKENGVAVYQSKVEVKDGEEKVQVEEGEKYYVKSDTVEEKTVTEIEEKDLATDFVQWNKELDQNEFSDKLGALEPKKEEPKEEAPKPAEPAQPTANTNTGSTTGGTTGGGTTPAPAPASITVTGATAGSDSITLSWTTANLDASQGYKVVYNTTGNPTYPNDNPRYISNPATKSTTFSLKDGKTYYFRVCRYTGSGCDTYSNQVTAVAPSAPAPTPVTGVSLTDNGGGNISWSITGGPGQGYKVAWELASDVALPEYPTHQHVFTNSLSKTLNAWNGAGTYNVRVCAGDGSGGCTAYSNVISVNL